ncbi:hypothetical protein SAY86_029731 [Trapa natans]|uniref:C2H2-type domain-containing protein n=1 Tax=Trapa natans TaxID=22666 RepID=A0AAN7RD74_TRANT|nr:hypothetical protein SAY86_029731 [Trapa natans]
MDQSQLLMWSKGRHNLRPYLKLGKLPSSSSSSYIDDSWEERAFAEDASGPLGGCIWPPRSYSCSFCRREFRSAQALGGHMNVHRRDRARLKELGNEILNSHEYHDQRSIIQSPSAHLGLPYPSQAYTTGLSQKPNPSSNIFPLISPSSPSRVSTQTSEANCNQRTITIPSYSFFKLNENIAKSSTHSTQSWADKFGSRYRHVMNPLTAERNLRSAKHRDGDVKEDQIKNDLSIGLNAAVQTRRGSSEYMEEEKSQSCKRRRTDELSTLHETLNNVAVDKGCHQETYALNSNHREDIDLELRLGKRPKVKLQGSSRRLEWFVSH